MSTGTVYRKDGKFLKMTESRTHLGLHNHFEWADGLNEATVFYAPIRTRLGVTEGAEALQATETRTVTIQ